MTTGDNEVLIPFAVMDGKQVWAKEAPRQGNYTCPSCGAVVILRRGAQRRPHFAHKADQERCEFVSEGVDHVLAKQRLVDLFEVNSNLRLLRRCPQCRKEIEQVVSTSAYTAQVEYHLSSGHRADVALFKQEQLRAVFEVYATHPVDEEKKTALAEIPWVEIEAQTILHSTSFSLREDHLRPMRCPNCIEIERRRKEEEHRVALWRNKSLVPFLWPFTATLYVYCPKELKRVVAVDTCAFCGLFRDATKQGILCGGEEVLGRSEGKGTTCYKGLTQKGLTQLNDGLHQLGYRRNESSTNYSVKLLYCCVKFWVDKPEGKGPIFFWRFSHGHFGLDARQRMIYIEWQRLGGLPLRLPRNLEKPEEADLVYRRVREESNDHQTTR